MPLSNKLNIPKIDSSSLVDKVEEALIDLLISKKLNPGDTIPKEMELTQMLGVSRTVIRESLGRLKSLGLIESIKHKGTIIRSPNLLHQLKKSFIPNILDQATLKDVFEIRLVLEIGMGDLIFQRLKKEDIEELEEIVKAEPNTPEDIHFEIEHEIKFHGKLYEMSGNQTLMDFQSLLLPSFRYVYDSELINSPSSDKKWVSHSDLVDILKTGTPNKFRNAMRKHLDRHFRGYFMGAKKV
ncbi:DNA-binding transcriptional regulator, FadR family [Saccharicrinis carchari]|uniref:DNA-binding transcriptional regulator, FadR family n=1 Tax=Saccharicrinis carchari TaxID=1168039 RepID=A0A521ENK4_SACCC|nr:FadR/GntR family transcriptional regulator [Saccharicrinis carchari]SMO85488.1 DNA-binding transcriptional regulator, FadR family [Saccharicrinis carchari]